MATFTFEGENFIYEGEKVRIISGAIHYFRVVPKYWKDRLLKLKACGFNTVETYIPWNFHERKPGQFYFSDQADFVEFIKIAGEIGLFVIVRPSPYICAEWEFGGLPSWLLKDKNMELRCSYEPYLEYVNKYYDVLLPLIKPLLCTNGGPVIAVQIENEYGSYGNDTAYLTALKDKLIEQGIDVLLFTSDGAEDPMLQGGMVPGILETVNFGSDATGSFNKLKEYQTNKPLVCMEFWNGWFDQWGKEHNVRDPKDVAHTLDDMLSQNGSVNFYMFHGGTNFGFYNGALQFDKDYEPAITSYDSDAPLSESGDPTDKFYAIRQTLEKYVDLPPLELPPEINKHHYGQIDFTERAQLFSSLDDLSEAVYRKTPETMEQLDQDYGFILYQTHVSGPRKKTPLTIQDVHDRAIIYLDNTYVGIIDRFDRQTLELDIPKEGAELKVFVENLGRINYGPYLKDYKGVTEGIRMGFQFLYDWTIYPLPLNDLSSIRFSNNTESSGPTFHKATFIVDDIGDTFVDLTDWTKGIVIINGFNIGRYWNKGPQETLYLPGPLLNKGENELIIFEIEGTTKSGITLTDCPRLTKQKTAKK
ncbi:beta-galactosidase [Halolactibacillus alkaliphilus]|uniref:beta-galactosidase n=1 Tax=Halolactibacillus alkaliphilus TaxID=442899 RepID=A0A511X0N0_9BACI|nr:beta-galactosidase family protein [Halolactibacillus alkaliphilus]GEN56470.1 beta-galactosidase [Halolactibacillus alkaliphilus]GGN64287.1 beta-galactosidase [Halolactibacillus alkaliphilus]SFO61442.1 beta-galactosidase [Halolactibacillus alkaliphilus]